MKPRRGCGFATRIVGAVVEERIARQAQEKLGKIDLSDVLAMLIYKIADGEIEITKDE